MCGGGRSLRGGGAAGWGGWRASGPSGGRLPLDRTGANAVKARGRVRVGALAGVSAEGRRRLPAACGPHPSPVVHCCFRGGGRAAVLRGPGLATPAGSPVARSPPVSPQAARRAATAGAL